MESTLSFLRYWLLLATICIVFPCTMAMAVETDSLAEDTLAKEVYASIIVADPGSVLYSRVGHCAIHMQAPEYDLDYVFSYESEDVRQKVLAFLAGKLKMGMFAVPIDEYLSNYKAEGRGVREYRLNLPLEVKRNLWRVLDEHVMQGANLPYDYLTRGCAHSTLMMLKEGLDTIPIQYGPWPEKFQTMTRRELMELQMRDSPWTKIFLYLITNGVVDSDCSNEEKVIIPTDLVHILQNAKIEGHTLLSEEAIEILPNSATRKTLAVTPLAIAIALLLLTIISVFFHKKTVLFKTMTYTLLSVQTIIGIVTVYLVCFSNLCCTEWSWLIIPFNPLPLILWKWRNHWAFPYSVIIILWAMVIILWPHSITDWTFIVFAITISIALIFESQSIKKK